MPRRSILRVCSQCRLTRRRLVPMSVSRCRHARPQPSNVRRVGRPLRYIATLTMTRHAALQVDAYRSFSTASHSQARGACAMCIRDGCQCNVACTAVHRPSVHECICAAGAPRMRCLQPLLLLFVQPGHLACGACNQKALNFDSILADHTAYTALHCAVRRNGASSPPPMPPPPPPPVTWSIRCACI